MGLRIMRKVNLFFKRLIDIICSSTGILLLLPLFLIVAVLIKVTMEGPILFTQERVGKGKKTFKIIKFRTMRKDKRAEEVLDFSKDKQRITTLGKILRRTKIDELPQLFNVLIGDMSLVGPRPTVMKQVEKYTDFQAQRLNMRPGMTGLAQVNGNVTLPWEQRISYDIEYINNFTIWLDLKILFKTCATVILGEGYFKKEKGAPSENQTLNV